MNTYQLITQKYEEVLENKINELIQQKELDEKKIEITRNEYTCFSYTFSKKNKEQIRQHLGTIISDIVQHEVLKGFATKYLKQQKDLKKYEKTIIKDRFIKGNYISKEEGVSYISYYLIYIPVLKELEKNEQVHIEGWINFRTQKYKMVLEDIIEQTISDYKAHKAYLECIKLLIDSKQYDDAHKQQDIIHLFPKKKGGMELRDAEGRDITQEAIENYSSDLCGEAFLEDDLIMNVFITAIPRRIIIHCKEQFTNQHFIETLEYVFKNQISHCEGCKDCQQPKDEKMY